ncbi:hypothetical protein ETH_00039835 [Eimeria tenella]|uniref:Protein SDA1 n=1 Tax=Eimeria tenella TaxID=5802 RepID=U6L4X6_EIMTE|nr:hypothetical protein ETH_00039835 [Eimeria tenella]CDJ44268.1 hypothetical protein ETH_00039835 [Eimeria tenella]|eukprot:XP_013235017.1 hypothetical protein ETH_00039835 [Eimeria tenella]
MKSLNDEQEESVMSLALLQNKIKRDPLAYREEFLLQLTNFRGLAEALKQQPYRPTRKLQSLVMFLAHTAPCYSAEVQDAWAGGPPRGPQDLPVFDAFGTESIPAPGGPSPSEEVKQIILELLTQVELHPTTRHALLNAMLLLRSRKMVNPKP